MSEIKRCSICKRNKNKAIKEQSELRIGCGVLGCVFNCEITRAIEEKSKIRVVKKEPIKIRVIKK